MPKNTLFSSFFLPLFFVFLFCFVFCYLFSFAFSPFFFFFLFFFLAEPNRYRPREAKRAVNKDKFWFLLEGVARATLAMLMHFEPTIQTGVWSRRLQRLESKPPLPSVLFIVNERSLKPGQIKKGEHRHEYRESRVYLPLVQYE